MTRRDRFTEIEDLIERMGREFEELGGTLDAPGPGVPGFPDTREIAVDVIEDDETITVLADLPGFDADGIEVELHDETLSITATHDETRDTEVTVDEDDATADDAVEGDAAEGADTGGDDSSEAGAATTFATTVASAVAARCRVGFRSPSPSTATARPPRTTTVYSPSPFPSGRRTMPATTSTCRDVAGREASVTAVIGLNPRIPCHKLSTILSSLIPQSTSLMVIIMNRNSPFDEIEQFLGRAPSAATAVGRDLRATDIDVAEYDDEFVVMADLPGYDREDIDVRATEGRLTITAEHDAASEDADRRYLRRERRHESVTRSVDLPGPVVDEDASATYRHGVLTITLPKAADETDDGHRIDVA